MVTSRPAESTPQARSRQRPIRAWSRLLRLLMALVLAVGTGGCQPRETDSEAGTLHVLIGTPSSESLTAESIETDMGEFKTLIDGFRELHPEVTLTFAVFQESRLMDELRRRNAAGLAPDLVLMSAARALQLEHHHLIRSVRITPEEARQLEIQGLSRVAVDGGRFAGVPVLQEPQLACFNRSQLPRSPATVDELIAMARNGTAFGLAVDPTQVFWSAGSLGAMQPILAALDNQPLSIGDKARIITWLQWLQTLNLQREVAFLPDKDHLVAQLARGELDWIPCRCGNIPLLKRHLGDRLGVAPLPDGPGGPPSPITRQLVWGFGLNSSQQQQHLAETLVRFSINPLTQRTVTLTTLEVLPANRLALPSMGISPTIDAMLESQKQGQLGHRFSRWAIEDGGRMQTIRELLVSVIFGELSPQQATDQLVSLEEPQR